MSSLNATAPVWTVFAPDRTSDATLQDQVYAFFRDAIAEGRLRPGQRLPSTRGLARETRLGRNTIAIAFDRLLAEGYVETRSGVGTVVAEDLADLPMGAPRVKQDALDIEGSVLPEPSGRARSMEALPLSEQTAVPILLNPGYPALEAFPYSIWARLASRFWRSEPAHLLGYQDPQGYLPLREAISEYLRVARGISATPDRILVTSGSQQAVDLVTRVLVEPGDKVCIEDPGYVGLKGAITASGAVLAPAPVDENGLIVAEARALCDGARLAIVTPTHQFPTGVTLSLARRLELLKWAVEDGVWVLEDDYDSEFRYEGRPLSALHGLDPDGRVIYVGTFSKILAPAIRLGYLVAPSRLIPPLKNLRAHVDRHPPIDSQAILARFIEEGHFGGHVRRMRLLYRERRDALVAALTDVFSGRGWLEMPSSGMHLTFSLPPELSDTEVSERLSAVGISCPALSAYCQMPTSRNGLLLGFANLPPDLAPVVAARLAGVLVDMTNDRHGRNATLRTKL
jgi:GntR family transcriptional regulator / MocR family aminotransferase